MRMKYRSVKSNGFSSKLESAVYDYLKLLERLGEIKNIECQNRVLLTEAEISCKIDFCYINKKTGKREWAEAKGIVTDRWRLIKKLWVYYGPGRLYIYTGDYRSPKISEVVDVHGSKTIQDYNSEYMMCQT